MLRSFPIVCGLGLALLACKAEPTPSTGGAPAPSEPAMPEPTSAPPAAPETSSRLDAGPDPHSFSRPDQVRVSHIGLNWVVDFDARTLTGDAILLLERLDATAPLLLDSRDLDIKSVHASFIELEPGATPELALDHIRTGPSREGEGWAETKFEIGEVEGPFGAPIEIELPPNTNAVKISYATRPSATGLQWLEPKQTAGKREPFLYSQSQAIHARSWIPSQDSPGVRTTWDAIVIAPKPLTVVMAADQRGELDGASGDANNRAFRFVMPERVPAYLIALGVGELERREIGPRTAVWADPTVVAQAATEFVDMEKMLGEAEALYGAYAWGRYDVLVLPPAFPFGGMENPRLTFVTPTLLAGDRSLVSVIAHELAHSWSGNLVTNKTWGDLWLNEGFTVYFERRIVERIYGPERAQIEAVIGKRELLEELEDPELLGAKPEFQKLRQDLRGIDPDESFSGVPYEKGALLLGALERAYGREVFDEFLRKWFANHAFGSVQSSDFYEFVNRELIATHTALPGQRVPDVDIWLGATGLPDDAPEPESAALDAVEQLAEQFGNDAITTKQIDTKGWSPWHWLHFLRSLPATATHMAALDEAFALTSSGNAEILGEWLRMVARLRYAPAYPRLESFLIEVGRRKFLTPIYRALIETPEGREQARAIYTKARPGYHAISRGTLDSMLQVD